MEPAAATELGKKAVVECCCVEDEQDAAEDGESFHNCGKCDQLDSFRLADVRVAFGLVWFGLAWLVMKILAVCNDATYRPAGQSFW